MKLKCIIIDDEPLALDLLKSYAVQTPFLNLVGTYNSAIEALDVIHNTEIELIFLDINMPKMNGLEFSKTLPTSIKVIFTTAYDQYALDGFKVNALDYLLKPISYGDFLNAAKRALEWYSKGNEETKSGLYPSETAVLDSIFVKSGYRIEKLYLNDILYIENQKDYVKFYIEGQIDPVSSLMSINQLAEKLPADQFMRVHRSFIVNLDKVKVIERNTIVFGKVYIPVSDSYKEKFYDFLNSRFL